MDYEAMTTPQLQAECRRRDLPTSRSKGVLVGRLRDADAAAGAPELTVEAEPTRVVTEPVPRDAPAPVRVEDRRRGWQPAPPTVFRRTFPVCPGGPDEVQHAAYREATLDAAVDAGHEPRGGAYRIGTTPDGEVYEINIRRPR